MALQRARLDRTLRVALSLSSKEVKILLASARVFVDGHLARDADMRIHAFSHVRVEDQVLQAREPRYLMLHKPAGLLSATRDATQPTVMSLLPESLREGLHLAGRLDKSSTGLVLLSDDSRWTQAGMSPGQAVEKSYRVQVRDPISPACVKAFAEGMYFAYEALWTLPATLEVLAPCLARVTLQEGRYHQIKRMFGRFRNPVLALHRERIGALNLDPALAPGEYRPLTPAEVQSAVQCAALGGCPDPSAAGKGA